MKNVKKAIALVSLAALVCANSAFAADLSLTGSTWTWLTLTWNDFSSLSWATAVWNLNVQVAATVLPTLSFDLNSNTLNLGDLTVGSYKKSSIGYNWVTNARLWMAVTVQSATLLDDSNWNQIWSNGNQITTSYKFGKDITDFSLEWTEFDKTVQNLDWRASNWPISWSFDVWAKIDAATIAWNYTDTLTFTVTWNF